MCVTISIDVCIPLSTYTARTPVPSDSEHAHILTKSSRAGIAVTRSELVELGAARRVSYRHMPFFEFRGAKYHNGFSSFFKKNTEKTGENNDTP